MVKLDHLVVSVSFYPEHLMLAYDTLVESLKTSSITFVQTIHDIRFIAQYDVTVDRMVCRLEYVVEP